MMCVLLIFKWKGYIFPVDPLPFNGLMPCLWNCTLKRYLVEYTPIPVLVVLKVEASPANSTHEAVFTNASTRSFPLTNSPVRCTELGPIKKDCAVTLTPSTRL